MEAKRKQALKKLGKLECEACKFDFCARYGSRGAGFIECHHTKPLATLSEGHKTHINDLALVCANCHRMIHRAKPLLTVEGMKKLLATRSLAASTLIAADATLAAGGLKMLLG